MLLFSVFESCDVVVSELNFQYFPKPDKIPSNNMRIVMESDSRKRLAVSHDGGLPPKKPWFDK